MDVSTIKDDQLVGLLLAWVGWQISLQKLPPECAKFFRESVLGRCIGRILSPGREVIPTPFKSTTTWESTPINPRRTKKLITGKKLSGCQHESHGTGTEGNNKACMRNKSQRKASSYHINKKHQGWSAMRRLTQTNQANCVCYATSNV